jgi:uncharacterized protein (TIGR02757 family)
MNKLNAESLCTQIVNQIKMTPEQEILYELLEDRYRKYNVPAYIDDDPIQIPHRFSLKEDIEIAAFLSASIAWGQRKTIIRNADKMMQMMDYQPYDFVTNATTSDFKSLQTFVHRTFNGIDLIFFVQSLQNIYLNYGGLEQVFNTGYQKTNSIYSSLAYFREVFMETAHEKRSAKQISAVVANSAAKRLNMLLRWLVRRDAQGVDLGIWQSIPASALMIPLDVHVGKVGRALGLLERRQDDWKAVEEITENLRIFDAQDPAKYDYALFGMGLNAELKAI